MKRYSTTLILIMILILVFSSNSYAAEEKSILIILDELDFKYVKDIIDDKDFGIGFMNSRTKKPYEDESFYFSISTGRKVGVSPEYYKGLYKNQDGEIVIPRFNEMLKGIKNGSTKLEEDILGEKLKDEGISYIGNDSSAIIAADNTGIIKSGEIEVRYDKEWLVDRTKDHLSTSNILVLSYNIDKVKNRISTLKEYIEEFKEHKIIIISNETSEDMNKFLNNSLVPVVYLNGNNNGTMTSSSTKREGFIVLEDIYAELISIYDEKDASIIGDEINIEEKEDNIDFMKDLFSKTNNLMWLTYIFHGLLYGVQCYSAYFIYKNRKDKFNTINSLNTFIIVNIFIGLLMGASNFHINIALYLSINLLISYIITVFMFDKETNTIGLFAILTYGLIIFAALFYPEIVYNSYLGFNNLFYGARYYGFNNGIMGVLLVTSIISYFFIRDSIKNDTISNLIFILFAFINIIILSTRYGSNTGGFLAATALLLIILYERFLKDHWNIKTIIIFVLIGVLIFSMNIYFDFLNDEKSHAINFFLRIKNYGIGEFLSMLIVKLNELIKFTIMPPFSIAIIAQLISLKILFNKGNKSFSKEARIILIVAIICFLINDTGNITFIFMSHYLISLLVNKYLEINFKK